MTTNQENNIYNTIRSAKARGDYEALLALVSEETIEAVADHFGVTNFNVAPVLAQRLFNAKSLTISHDVITFGRTFNQYYDLTDNMQALDALRHWAQCHQSFKASQTVDHDIKKYHELAKADPTLSRHQVTRLVLIRGASQYQVA